MLQPVSRNILYFHPTELAAYTHLRFLVTFHCMFMTTKFHSQKLKFPMSKYLPFAKYFSGREVVADKTSSKASNNRAVT